MGCPVMNKHHMGPLDLHDDVTEAGKAYSELPQQFHRAAKS